MWNIKDVIAGPKCSQLALHAGVSVGRQTPPERVEALITRLRPQRTAVPLVRLGPPRDGGYLVPDSLAGVRACFSPGVSTESGFDLACARQGMEVHMADASVDGPAVSHPRFRFLRKHVGMCDSDSIITLDTWIDSAGIGRDEDLLLQMDVEGTEYAALASLSPGHLRQFRHIVVEFHQLQFLWHEMCFEFMQGVFSKLLSDHMCVHIHPNNAAPVVHRGDLEIPVIMEFTFSRRRDTRTQGPCAEFPHHLDRPNLPDRPDICLPSCWR